MTDRPIKFRVWNATTKKMHYLESTKDEHNHYLQVGSGGFWLYESISGKLMACSKDGDSLLEFTGLKDKNRVEIWEGDILAPFSEDIGPYTVTFENGSFVCYSGFGRWGLLSRAFDHDIAKTYDAIIIGNIYEHPPPDEQTKTNPEWDKIILYMGENIFPLKRTLMVEKFDPEEIIKAIVAGYIQASMSKVGTSATRMTIKKGYFELSDEGWERYQALTGSTSNT